MTRHRDPAGMRRFGAALAVLVAAAIGVLLTPGAAFAHATLEYATPAAGEIASTAPSVVRLRFSEPVEVAAGAVRITGPDGRVIPGSMARRDADSAATVVVPLPQPLAEGTFTVTWNVVSVDGHPVGGEFRFANQSATTPLSTGAYRTREGPTVLGGTGRAVAVTGAVALFGLGAFPVLVMWPVRRRLPTDLTDAVFQRLRVPLASAAAAGTLGTLAVLVDTAAGANGRDALAVLGRPAEVFSFAVRDTTGPLLLTRVACLLGAAALLVVRGRQRRPGRYVVGAALAVALLCLATFSLSSHAAGAAVDQPLAVGFDAIHLVAVGIWAGGLLALGLAGLPAAGQIGGRDRTTVADLTVALAMRFSIVAQGAMLVVLATGGYVALLHVSSIRDLGGSPWGIELTVKLALFATVLLFAAASAVTFVPLMAGRVATLARRLAAAGEMRTAIRIELGLAAALLGVAALMSGTATPAPQRQTAAVAKATQTASARGVASGFTAEVDVARYGGGAATATVFTVALSTEGTAASAPSADAVLRGVDGVDRRMDLVLTGEGHWRTERLAVAPGTYVLTARFNRLGNPLTIPVTIAVP